MATIALDREEIRTILDTIRSGFIDATGHTRRPNNTIAMALWTEATLGIRISDVVKLTLSNIVREKGRYHLDMVEQKTGKHRSYIVPAEVYATLKDYAGTLNNGKGIEEDELLFDVKPRVIQKHLKITREYLEMEGRGKISTHSFRKNAGAELYEITHDVELVRQFYQHSSVATTQRYLGVDREKVDAAIMKRDLISFE